MKKKEHWLDCVCGEPVFKIGEDGLFWDETKARCPECGCMCYVRVSDDYSDCTVASCDTDEDDCIVDSDRIRKHWGEEVKG